MKYLGEILADGDMVNKKYVDQTASSAASSAASGKQDTLVSGTNIKTVNNNSLLGSGDVAVQPVLVSGTNIKTINNNSLLGSGDIAVQPTLVSGTNIKTINNESLLGSGNVSIQGGASISTVQVSITVANWNATTTCTKSVTGVTASNTVIVAPIASDASMSEWCYCFVACTGQGNGTLTFGASVTPENNITVNVVIIG